MRSSERDYYKVLQVDAEADPDVITAAFRVLARRLHPDRDLTGVHEIRMSELNRAYGVLRDPETRRTYDAERAEAMRPVGPGLGQEESSAQMAYAARPTGVDGTPDGDAMVNGGLTRRMAMGNANGAQQVAREDVQLDFGRYAGSSIRELARRDPDYLRWLARHSSGIRFRNEIASILKEPVDDPYAPSR
jgi:DnaJ-class molecular chaperone